MSFTRYNPHTDEQDYFSSFITLDEEPETADEGDAYINNTTAQFRVYFAGQWQTFFQFGGFNYLTTEDGDTITTEDGQGIYLE